MPRPKLTAPLRYATVNDCRQIAELAEFAGEGIPTYLWSQQATSGETALDVGARNVASENESFSYRNTIVLTANNTICAMLLAYRLTDHPGDVELDNVPELVRPLVELELLVPGSYYINMIATYPQYRGRGYGSLLLNTADTLADFYGCDELSIEVFEENTGAHRLYQRNGFTEKARIPVVKHPCYPFSGDVLLLTRPVKTSLHR